MSRITRVRGIRSPVGPGSVLARSDGGTGPVTPHKAQGGILAKKGKLALQLTGDVSNDTTGKTTVGALAGVPLDVSTLTNGFVLAYDSGSSTLKLQAGGASGATAFTGLTDVPGSYSGASLKGVRVNASATGLEFHAPLFTDLADAPSSYTSQALKAVRVNAGATALEFYTPSSGGATAFTGLSDVPASYSGQTLKAVRVNAGETALEFYTPSAGGGYSAGTPPTIVQSVVDNSGAATITFPSAPTNGNILVVMAFNPTVGTQGTGWTLAGNNGAGTDFGLLLTKTAGASEPALQTPLSSSPGGTGVLMGWELTPSTLLSVFGQAEQGGVFSVALTANISNNCICLSAVASPTPGNITTGYNVGNQDALIANSGNRRILAGHGTLADFPFGGLFCKFASSASSKSITAVFIN